MGKCAVSGKVLSIGDIHCHHKVPRYLGGKDNYQNLVLVCEDVHHLIHATNPDIIRKYMEILNLDQKQKEKLNKLRSLVTVKDILQVAGIDLQETALYHFPGKIIPGDTDKGAFGQDHFKHKLHSLV